MTTRPDWLRENATVYAVFSSFSGEPTIIDHTVLRFTQTQVVTQDQFNNARRWRLDDLREVGNSNHRGPVLASPTDPQVRKALAMREVATAMRSLRAFIEGIQHGAKIYKNDPDTAIPMARELADLARTAHDAMVAVVVDQGEKALKAGETS